MPYTDQDAAPLPLLVSPPPPSDDEPHLIRRAQQKDVSAFEQLYRLHVRRVYALCRRMTDNAGRAEELTQTAFINAWEKLPYFRGESAFSSWLHRLAVNVVLMELRTTRRREQRVFPAHDLPAFETASTPTTAGVRLDLEQAIAALPPQARLIFVLHDVEGWKHEEIAARLGRYAEADQRLALSLLEKLRERTTTARTNDARAIALFDVGFYSECLRQARMIDHADGYDLLVKANELRGGDPEIQFALALAGNSPRRAEQAEYLRRARLGAKDGSLLAVNLASHFGQR